MGHHRECGSGRLDAVSDQVDRKPAEADHFLLIYHLDVKPELILAASSSDPRFVGCSSSARYCG